MSGLYDHGYGRQWQDVLVYRREGYTTSVADLHKHRYYELNLIFSGNIRILLPHSTVETERSHVVLTAPDTPHFISCLPDQLYSRLYLCFSESFVEGCLAQWDALRAVFGQNGSIVALSQSETELCRKLIEQIERETEPLRQRLLIFYLLSCIADFSGSGTELRPTPPYIIEALSYIHRHYGEKILASALARQLHIGRTTLMTGFKRYTGSSLNEYLVSLRVKNAARLLRDGKNVQEAAEACGFADSGSLIRSFRKAYGVTPGKYLQKQGT